MLFSQFTLAGVYKCKSASGKTIYSESECPSGTSGSQINLEANVIDSSAIRNKISEQKTYSTNTNYQSTAATSNRSAENLMTTYDKQTRLRELSIDMKDDRAFSEKRSDAKNEYAYLSGVAVHSLSYENELKRRDLKLDLNSSDISKRSNAFQALLALYNRYKSQ
jgi:hypothetical protein